MKFNTAFFIRSVAVVLILAGVGLAAFAAFRSSDKADVKPVFADRTMLAGLWNNYKTEYWESSTGRTLDKQQNSITTSEGQSYTMLRAVWQGDKTTFDKTWGWTKQQLQRPDKLFSWRWGQHADGTYGILTEQNGQNTASDADSDIALALVMAASRWQQQSYLDDAKPVISSLWQNEVLTVKGTPYLVANNLEKTSTASYAIINPSYLAPYSYRIFARVDTTAGHDWNGLVGASYDLINEAIDDPLDRTKSGGLPPNWVLIDRTTGALSAPTAAQTGYTTDYGYDAFRTAWRLALDYRWNNEPRAKTTLAKMSALDDAWKTGGLLDATYGHDGSVTGNYESLAAYGADLGYFIVSDPDAATQIYQKKLQYLYDPNTNAWQKGQTVDYYSDNWAWFGMALYINALDNLAAPN